MSEERKKPGVAFWATVAVAVALIGYPLSYGPWLGLRAKMSVNAWYPERLYCPLAPIVFGGPDWLINPYVDYLRWWDASVAEQIREVRGWGAPASIWL